MMNYLRSSAKNDHCPMASVVAIGVMTGTLVQLPSDLYNGVCISGIKEDDAYSLVHRTTCARSPPKTRKTQRVASLSLSRETKYSIALVDLLADHKPSRASLITF